MLGHLLPLADHLGGVQQRLGRDAADIEAHSSERRPALDQDHLLAEVRGPKGGAVAAVPLRSCTDQRRAIEVEVAVYALNSRSEFGYQFFVRTV